MVYLITWQWWKTTISYKVLTTYVANVLTRPLASMWGSLAIEILGCLGIYKWLPKWRVQQPSLLLEVRRWPKQHTLQQTGTAYCRLQTVLLWSQNGGSEGPCIEMRNASSRSSITRSTQSDRRFQESFAMTLRHTFKLLEHGLYPEVPFFPVILFWLGKSQRAQSCLDDLPRHLRVRSSWDCLLSL